MAEEDKAQGQRAAAAKAAKKVSVTLVGHKRFCHTDIGLILQFEPVKVTDEQAEYLLQLEGKDKANTDRPVFMEGEVEAPSMIMPNEHPSAAVEREAKEGRTEKATGDMQSGDLQAKGPKKR